MFKFKRKKEIEILESYLDSKSNIKKNNKYYDVIRILEIQEYLKDEKITKEGYSYLQEIKQGFMKKTFNFILKPYIILSIIFILIMGYLNIFSFSTLIYNGILYKVPGINLESINKISDIIDSQLFIFRYKDKLDNGKGLDNYSFPCSKENNNENKVECRIINKTSNEMVVGYYNKLNNKISENNFGISLIKYNFLNYNNNIYITGQKTYSYNSMNNEYKSIKDDDNCYKKTLKYNLEFKIISEECLGLNNELIENVYGYVKKNINYITKEKGTLLIKTSYLGIDGNLKISSHDEGIYAIKEKEYNKNGELLTERYFGDNNHSIGLKDYYINQIYYGKMYEYFGSYKIIRLLDEYGNNLISNGITTIEQEFDKYGNKIKETYKGKDLNITLNEENIAIMVLKYNNNNQIVSEEYFGVNGEKVNNIRGFHKLDNIYINKDGKKIEKYLFYDVKGKLFEGNSNKNIDSNFLSYKEYDENDNIIYDLMGYSKNDYIIFKYNYSNEKKEIFRCFSKNIDIYDNNLVLSEVINEKDCDIK